MARKASRMNILATKYPSRGEGEGAEEEGWRFALLTARLYNQPTAVILSHPGLEGTAI